MPALDTLGPSQAGMAFIEFSVKCASTNPQLSADAAQRSQMLGAEFRIYMVEHEQLSASDQGACIELLTSTRITPIDATDPHFL
jgi:hypothetical protein